MTILAPKRPAEIRKYVFDYTRELARDPVQAFQIAVTSGNVTVQSTEQHGCATLIAFLAGGVNGQTSTFELQMTTESGQLLIRDFSLLTVNGNTATGDLPSSTTKMQLMEMALAQLGLAGIGWNTAPVSTTTKGQVVNMAYEEVGLAGYEFDATSAEQASALQRLDSLMAQLSGPGANLNVGYNFPAAIGGSAMADKSGIPDILLDATVCMLALSLAPLIGKTLGAEVQLRIKNGVTTTRIAYAVDLRTLDALMAQWASAGMNLDLGYNFPSGIGGSLLTDPSGVPDIAVEAVVLSLAMALPIPDKVITPDMSRRLAQAMIALRASLATIPRVKLPRTTARGAGAKPWSTWEPFIGSWGAGFGPPGSQTPAPLPPGSTAITTEDGRIITTESGEAISV